MNSAFEYQTLVLGYMMRNREVSPLAKLVYSRIGILMDNNTFVTHENIGRFAYETGASLTDVMKAIEELSDKRFIRVLEVKNTLEFKIVILRHECMKEGYYKEYEM